MNFKQEFEQYEQAAKSELPTENYPSKKYPHVDHTINRGGLVSYIKGWDEKKKKVFRQELSDPHYFREGENGELISKALTFTEKKLPGDAPRKTVFMRFLSTQNKKTV